MSPSSPELSDDVLEIMRRPNPAVMATVRPDGAPVTVATWYLWDDGRILLNLDGGRRRLEHLRTDPRVSLTVLDDDSWYRHVSIQGHVVQIEDDPDLEGIDRLAVHYTGKPYRLRDRPRVNAWVEVDRVHTWGLDRR